MFCAQCGTKVAADAIYCWKCGAKLAGSRPGPDDASGTDKVGPGSGAAPGPAPNRETPRGLMAYQYEHPDDTRATDLLKAASPVIATVRAMITNWNEPALKAQLLGNAVKVGPQQYPEIHEITEECARIFNLETPDVFIKHDPYFNAMTFGVDQAFIILHSALVDGFDGEELHYIIGHEIGHIKSQHVLYLTTAYILANQALAIGQRFLPLAQLLVIPARAALETWRRSAELTADRAGLIAAQDLRTSSMALIKLAVGSKELASRLNYDEYLRQIEQAEQHTLAGPVQTFASHPMVARRVRRLKEWSESPAYRSLWPSRRGSPDVATPAEREEQASAILDRAMSQARRGSSLAAMWLAIGGDRGPVERALRDLETLTEDYPETSAARKAQLYRAVAQMNLRLPYEAVVGFEGFAERYPNDPLAPEALFHAAHLYEATLRDAELARAAYERLCDRYPRSNWSKEARAALRRLR
ncbi:MAG TPA: M48 family metalloprotease [Bacillota bacterium]